MVKLIYGLAKFSNQKYGFGSRPKNFNKKNFLKDIQKYFNIFECSDRYKKSNLFINLFRNKKVHFKIDKIPINKNEKQIETYFKKKIKFYNNKHNSKNIEVLYLHENSLKIISSKKILKILKKLKKENFVKNFGVSVYTENELKFSLQNDIYTYIQIPINLADSYFFFKYRKKMIKKKVVGRSLVLQGKLLNSRSKIKFKNKISKYIKKIDQICFKFKIDREELVYRYVLSLGELDYALVGSINYNNIKNIIKFKKKGPLNKEIMKKLIYLSRQKKTWSDPRRWL